MTSPKIGGGRNRQFFKEKAEAKTVFDQKQIERDNYGAAAMSFDERQRAEYLECSEKLEPFGWTLRQAVDFCLPHLQASNQTVTINELLAKLLEYRKQDGARPRYLADLHSRVGQFARCFKDKPVSEFTFKEVDGWLRSLDVAMVTRNNFRRALLIAFNFAVEHDYCTSNPVAKTDAPEPPRKRVEILSVQEAAGLLTHADAKILPAIALGLFAGLRPESESGLDWKQIDFKKRLIDIENTKRPESERFVDIPKNLVAWLPPYRKASGRVFPSIDVYYDLLKEAWKKAGIAHWPHDALRHSFGSYHYGAFENAPLTMKQMGHTNPKTFSKHYRRKLDKKVARPYWRIVPAAASKKIVAFKAA